MHVITYLHPLTACAALGDEHRHELHGDGGVGMAGGGFPTRPHLAKAGGEDAKSSQNGYFQVGKVVMARYGKAQ